MGGEGDVGGDGGEGEDGAGAMQEEEEEEANGCARCDNTLVVLETGGGRGLTEGKIASVVATTAL